MQLQQLHDIATLFATHTMITHIARIADNVIHIRLDSVNYCIDLDRGNPQVYSHENALKTKQYNAPFDIAMSKYLYKAQIQGCTLDGMNKILQLSCVYQNAYKRMETLLQIECITHATNAIILQDNKVVSALRFHDKGSRIILPRMPLPPMPQPHFFKELATNNPAQILESLRQNYQNIQATTLEQKRTRVLHSLTTKRAKLIKLLDQLPHIETLREEQEEQFRLANYVLANLDSIPNYATHVTIENKTYTLPIAHKPSIASDKLFKQVKKIKQKIEHSYLQKENLESKITFLTNQIQFAQTANNEELTILTPKKNEVKKEQKSHYASFYIDGIKISMGRNERENIKLLQESKADFIWLHLCDVPSSHLIIHANRVSDCVLEYAGILLAKLCGIKDNKFVIDYTKRRFVKLTQGAHVVYAKEKKLHIQLRKE